MNFQNTESNALLFPRPRSGKAISTHNFASSPRKLLRNFQSPPSSSLSQLPRIDPVPPTPKKKRKKKKNRKLRPLVDRHRILHVISHVRPPIKPLSPYLSLSASLSSLNRRSLSLSHSLSSMASSSPLQLLPRGLPAAALLLLLLLLVLAPAADALACSSQKITNSTLYSTCVDLPTLNASLHFSYDPANSSAAVAFVAAPPKGEDGWVSWALNPTATGMFGAQALIAFHDAGAMTVKTYNITSTTVRESPISFETWERTAEYNSADGTMRIYAKIKVPTGDPAKLNQVWQVGSSVTNGVPDKHAMAAENRGAKGTLDLVAGTGRSPAPAPTLVAPPPSGVSRIGEGSNGAFLVLSFAFLVSSFFGFY